MHYYSFNIKDYRKDTQHLKPMEHYIYRMLIDLYYMDEKPIPKKTQWVMRRLMLDNPEHENMLKNVLDDFFYECDEGFRHKRIDCEITKYHGNAQKNRENGKKGGRPRKNNPEITHSVTDGLPLESQNNPNQEPITNNHKPSNSNNNSASDFSVIDSIADWIHPELAEMNAMLMLGAPSVPAISQADYDHQLVKFKNYYAEREIEGSYVRLEGRRKDILTEWIKRDYIRQQKIKAQSAATPRFNIDNEDWTKATKPAADDSYHPSHTKPVAQAKANPKTSVMVNGLWKEPLHGMSVQQTYDYIAQCQMPGEMQDETYNRLLNQMQEAL
ncbi:YdaU family protein [Psychrobacter faecalis]|uniref:YdaU family protein n=1 Tax=Psychrobacter faecalis TaxID=180588 RepID=UPI003FD4F895